VVCVIYSNGVRSLVFRDDGIALSIKLSDVIKLMIKDMNNDLCTVGVLQQV